MASADDAEDHAKPNRNSRLWGTSGAAWANMHEYPG